MKLMHTRLPDFYDKLKAAARRLRPETGVEIRGLENVKTGKLASLRVGRIEHYIYELTKEDEGIDKIEVVILPRVPESAHTVVIKGIQKDGSCKKAVLENIYLSSPLVDCELVGVEEVVDKRARLELDDPR